MSMFPSTATIEDLLDVLTDGDRYLALYTSNPGVGDTGTEVTGGSYARQEITFSSTSSAARSNTVALTFAGLPTATITHFGVRDAVSGGNLITFGALNSSVATITGDQVQFQVGALEVTVAGS